MIERPWSNVAYGSPSSRRQYRRLSLLGVITSIHLVLIALLIGAATHTTVRSEKVAGLIAVFDTEKPAPAPAPSSSGSPPRAPVNLAELRVVLPSDAPAPPVTGIPLALNVLGVPIGGGCDVMSHVQRAVEDDPDALRDLASLPAGVRTEADAVLLWDGKWMPSAQLLSAGSPRALRHAVEQAVVEAPAACLDEPVTGPRFVPIATEGVTVMLVIGSGEWRWLDLLVDTELNDPCLDNSTSCHPRNTVSELLEGLKF